MTAPAVWEWVQVAVADVEPGDVVRFPDVSGSVENAVLVVSVHGPRLIPGALGFVFDHAPGVMYAPGVSARVERWERVDAGGVS